MSAADVRRALLKKLLEAEDSAWPSVVHGEGPEQRASLQNKSFQFVRLETPVTRQIGGYRAYKEIFGSLYIGLYHPFNKRFQLMIDRADVLERHFRRGDTLIEDETTVSIESVEILGEVESDHHNVKPVIVHYLTHLPG